MTQQQGLSSEDFRARAQAATLKRNGTAALPAVDPLQQALAVKRQILGEKIIEQSVNEVDAAALKAQNEALKLQIERRQLEEAARAGDAHESAPAWQDFLFKQLEGTQGQLAEAQRALATQQAEMLRERLDLLRGELDRLHAERGREPQSVTALVRGAISEAQELLDTIRPPAPAVPVPPSAQGGQGEQVALQAWMRRVELQHEQWVLQREDRHRERMRELELQHKMQERELSAKEEHFQRMDRFMSETAPKVVDILSRVVQHFAAGGGAPAPAVAADADPPVGRPAPPTPAPVIQPGARSMPCAECGATVIYRPEWPGVFCQACGAEYGAGAGGSASPAPAGQEVPA